MKDIIRQCFICKEGILKDHPLDPCSVAIDTNCDKDDFDQRSQVFFCHYQCFRQIHNDDDTLYLESLSTHRESEEEHEMIVEGVSDFAQVLYEENQGHPELWKKLMGKSQGTWTPLRNLITKNGEITEHLNTLEEKLLEPLLITWTEDFSSQERLKKGNWKVIILATESHYKFPCTLLIDLKDK